MLLALLFSFTFVYLVRKLLIGFPDVVFLSPLDNFYTAFLSSCGRHLDLLTATCIRIVVSG